MTDMFNITMFGDKQLDKMFMTLPYNTQRSVMLKAFRKSSKPMVVTMKSSIRTLIKHQDKSTGNLEKSVGSYAPRQKIELDIGTRKFYPWKGHHGHLLEAGTEDRAYTTSGGPFSKGVEHKTGRVAPKFWFAKSVNQTKNTVAGRFMDDRMKAFHDHVIKYNKKAKT